MSAGTPRPALLMRPAPAAAAFALLTLAMTFPLWLHPVSTLPAGVIDLWSNHWNFWWWRECLWGLRANPFHCDHLFFPTGIDALFHTHSVFNMVVSAPVNLLLGPAAALNFCSLFAIASSGFFAWLLARDLTGDGAAAFIAGLVYAFIPQRLEFMTENLNLMSSQFMPLAVFFLRRSAREGGWRNAAGLAAAYVLNALADWQLGLMLTLALAAGAVWFLAAPVRSRLLILRDWSLAAAAAALALAPFVVPMFRVMMSGEDYFQKQAVEKGLDAAFLLLPHPAQPLWGGFSLPFFNARLHDTPGFACYLGYAPMILAAAAMALAPRRSWRWGVLFALMLLLALGSHSRWNGRLASPTLPFEFLASVPILRFVRVANRFFIPASLAWAVLAAFGWVAIRSHARVLWLIVCTVILIEFAWLPYPVRRLSISPGHDLIAASSNEGAVLDLPAVAGVWSVANMTAQTRHGRSIVGGYLATMPPTALEFMRTNPAFGQFHSPDPPMQGAIEPKALRAMGFAFVTLRRDWSDASVPSAAPSDGPFERKLGRIRGQMPAEKWQALDRQLRERIGPPFYEDGEIVIFELR